MTEPNDSTDDKRHGDNIEPSPEQEAALDAAWDKIGPAIAGAAAGETPVQD